MKTFLTQEDPTSLSLNKQAAPSPLASGLPLRELIRRHIVDSCCLSARLGKRGLNDVKWREAHSHIVCRNKTGHGNVCIFHLCGTLLLISWAVLKLTWITIMPHKRICICCLSCRVEMGLCVCTQWAVMRSAAVQLAKWNPNKRSHFTLMAAKWLQAGQG